MVPVKMRNENVGVNSFALGFPLELLTQRAESGAAVEDVEIVTQASFDAGGVSSIAQVVGLGSRRRSTHAPELDTHTPPLSGFGLTRHLPTAGSIRQFIRWLLSARLLVVFWQSPSAYRGAVGG